MGSHDNPYAVVCSRHSISTSWLWHGEVHWFHCWLRSHCAVADPFNGLPSAVNSVAGNLYGWRTSSLCSSGNTVTQQKHTMQYKDLLLYIPFNGLPTAVNSVPGNLYGKRTSSLCSSGNTENTKTLALGLSDPCGCCVAYYWFQFVSVFCFLNRPWI